MEVLLPVWDRPNGRLVAWVRNGLILPTDGTAPSPLTGAGMVETDYEQLSFIVTASRAYGWLSIRLQTGT